MEKIGFWKTSKNYMSHMNGLTETQVAYLQNLKVGDRLVIFVNDVREGEKGASLILARSMFVAEPAETTEAK